MASSASTASVPPSRPAPPKSSSTQQGHAAAVPPASTATETAAASAAPGVAIPTELKSEAWPYPLKLPIFPLDFKSLRNPKIAIFHDACGNPLVRYYWPASTATAEDPSTQKDAATRPPTRARGVVVLVHDEGTHTVFDWLKNSPLMRASGEETTGAVDEFSSAFLSKESSTIYKHLAAPPPVEIRPTFSELCCDVKTALEAEAAAQVPPVPATVNETLCKGKTVAEEEAEAALKGKEGDAAAGEAAGAAAAALTAVAAATEGVASLLPALPLFRDLPQKPLHAVRTACYEGSWVELFNRAGLDVHAVDLLHHGLSGLVERQQQRQRRRRRKQGKKSQDADASGGDTIKEEDEKHACFSFDLLAEDLCSLLEDICRFSTLPVFLLGQGIGATAATRAAELLAKKGKLGKPHLMSAAADATTQSKADLTAAEELLLADRITAGYENVAASPVLSGVRHIGKQTIIPVPHITVQARPIPLAGLVLLSPVLQLREAVALEQMVNNTGAAATRGKVRQRNHNGQHLQQKTESADSKDRRLSGESYISELHDSTSADEGEGEQEDSSWKILSWFARPFRENGRPAPAQYGVRLRRRRHPQTYQHVLLPPLDTEEAQELAGKKNEFDALYEKLYFHDKLTIKTLLPYSQLAELRKGVCHTLHDARWLLIPIERDSQQVATAAAWQEQYRKWKETIATRIREEVLGGAGSSEQLLQQQGALPPFIEEDPLAGIEPSVDLTPWLQMETPAAPAVAGATPQAAYPGAGKAASEPQLEEEYDIQQEEDASEAEVRRRKQLKRMQMAFYLKVLVVQGMTAPQHVENAACGCSSTVTALPPDREVECFAEAPDVQGVVSFYRSLGGKASVARRILAQHGQLWPPPLKKSKGKSSWLPDCCQSTGDDAAVAAALAAAATAEAAQTDSLVLLDVGSEEERMGDESEWEEEDTTAGTAAEDGREEDASQASGDEATATELGGIYGSEVDTREAAFVSPGVPSPCTLLPPAAGTGAPRLPEAAAEEGADGAAAAETRRDSDASSNAAIEARYAALQAERKRLDENLRLLDADMGLSPGTPAGRAAAQMQLHSTLRRHSSVYKSVYERDLLKYGTTVRLPDRQVPLGEPTTTTDLLSKLSPLRRWRGLFGKKEQDVSDEAATEASLEAGKPGVETPRLERLNWVKAYPLSWRNCAGGLLLPFACLQAGCGPTGRVEVVEEVSVPVRVVEKIIMHEATDALKATIAEIAAREQQHKKAGISTATSWWLSCRKESIHDREAPTELSATRGALAEGVSGKPKKLLLRDVQSWRRVGGIVVNGKGKQVPLEQVEKLRVRHPREYVNLFLYGATSGAAAALAGEAAAEGVRHRQVTLWLLPEVHHAALCQADEENKLGREILNKWLLPALEDLQQRETSWQGSRVRSQLRKQISNRNVVDLKSARKTTD